MKSAFAAFLTIAALAAAPARAEEGGGKPARTVSVVGRSVIETRPDLASVSIGVTNKAATTAAAIEATSGAAARIANAARTFGIAPRDVQTGYLSLQPAYRNARGPDGNQERRPDGFTASNSVVVRVRDLPRLGEFLRDVVDGGANQIGGVTFEMADPGKAEREALAAAVRDARLQAETIAEAAGMKIVAIESIDAGGDRTMPRPVASSRALPMKAAEVPVEPGSLDVTSEVRVTFSLGTR